MSDSNSNVPQINLPEGLDVAALNYFLTEGGKLFANLNKVAAMYTPVIDTYAPLLKFALDQQKKAMKESGLDLDLLASGGADKKVEDLLTNAGADIKKFREFAAEQMGVDSSEMILMVISRGCAQEDISEAEFIEKLLAEAEEQGTNLRAASAE
jgi:hypothetical protein